jgi:hypothetical protein
LRVEQRFAVWRLCQKSAALEDKVRTEREQNESDHDKLQVKEPLSIS